MRKHKSKNGVTMVETAGMLIFIFILLGLIITGGQMVSNKNALNYATQAAIRVAAVQPTEKEARSIAEKTAAKILESNGLATNKPTVILTKESSWSRGNNFTLQVITDYKTLFPLLGMEKSSNEGKNVYKMSTKVVAMIEAK